MKIYVLFNPISKRNQFNADTYDELIAKVTHHLEYLKKSNYRGNTEEALEILNSCSVRELDLVTDTYEDLCIFAHHERIKKINSFFK